MGCDVIWILQEYVVVSILEELLIAWQLAERLKFFIKGSSYIL